jgi:hypothetical protein
MQGDESAAATIAVSQGICNLIRIPSLRREEQRIEASVGVDTWQSVLAVDPWAHLEAVVAVLKLKITKQRTAPAR